VLARNDDDDDGVCLSDGFGDWLEASIFKAKAKNQGHNFLSSSCPRGRGPCPSLVYLLAGIVWWLGGLAVRALDTRPKGPRFTAQPMHYQVTTLGKLFTPTCLCRCKCLVIIVDPQLSGCGSILAAGHLQATLSKLLTYCVLRPTQPPIRHGMGNE